MNHRSTVFPEPRWTWFLQEQAVAYGKIENQCVISVDAPKNGPVGLAVVNLVVPGDMIKFAFDIYGSAKKLKFYIDIIDARAYLVLAINDKDEVNLWYWTYSNAPRWLQEFLGEPPASKKVRQRAPLH